MNLKRCGAPFLAAMLALLLGCAAKKDLVAAGGSWSDGTVDLSYELGLSFLETA